MKRKTTTYRKAAVSCLICALLLAGCSQEKTTADNSTPPTESKVTIGTEVTEPETVQTTAAPTTQEPETAQTTVAPTTQEPVDQDYYKIATNFSATDVEQFALQVKQLFLDHDWQALSELISYPINIDEKSYSSSTEFLAADFSDQLNPDFFVELEEETCTQMFHNGQGIMLGKSGCVWIGEVLNADLSSQGLKIIAINGLTL